MTTREKTEPRALGKSPIPILSSNDMAILGIEIASIPALVAGIFLMAIGQSKGPKFD